jgi:hypothetical protein
MDNEKDIHNKCAIFEHSHMGAVKWFSWTAVLIGALVGIGITFLLHLFSIAITLSAFTVNNTTGETTIAIGGLIGIMIGVIAAMFTAGWIAGYLGRTYCCKRHLGALYGFTTWCLALLLSILIASYVGRYVTSYTNFISNPTVITSTKPFIKIDTMSTSSSTEMMIDTQKSAKTSAINAFIVFVLFFLSALASCFGGHFGMCYRKDEKYDIEQIK